MRALRSSAVVRMLVGTGLAQGFLVVSGILAARLLGPEDRGHLALLVLPPMILGSVGGLGLPQALGYRWAREPAARWSVVRAVAPAALAQAVVLTVATAAVYAWVLRPSTPETGRAAVILLASTAGVLAWQYGVAAAQGRQRFELATVGLLAAPGLYVLGLVGAFLAGFTDLVAIATVWTASYVMTGAFVLAAALHGVRPSAADHAPVRLRELVGFGIRAVPNLASPLQALRLDQAAVGMLLGATSLGLYVAALAVTNLPIMLAMFMSVTIAGRVAAEPDPADARRALRRMIAGLALASAAVAGALWLVTPVIIPALFGAEFAAASTPARILLIGAVAAALQRSVGDGVRALGDPGASAAGEISSWVVLVPTLLVLSVALGLEGAAIAVALTYATGLVVVLAQWSRRHSGAAVVDRRSRRDVRATAGRPDGP